jgi:phosphoenolpyruvate---glycerone phosphotransferase subunit DhaL
MSSLTVLALTKWLLLFSDLLSENTENLTRLDSAIGDADHGINMERGAEALRASLTGAAFDAPSDVFQAAGDALLEGVGGAAGPLYASFFFGAARASVGETVLDSTGFGRAVDGGVAELMARGRAELGDKTMVDAALPAARAMSTVNGTGQPLYAVLLAGRDAANEGRDATKDLQALKGRASYLGPRSVGHVDPGAASMTLLFDALSVISDELSVISDELGDGASET